MKRYQFLLFDADGTLLDFETACAHAFQRTYFAQGLEFRMPSSGRGGVWLRGGSVDWGGEVVGGFQG